MSLFPTKATIVAELRADRLVLAGKYFKASALSDDYLYSKVVTAEAQAARSLRVPLEPTTFFAGEPTADEITAVGTNPWQEESAYDYEPDLWNPEDWGYLVLRQKPVISVSLVEFVYPSPVAGTFAIPANWIRLDKKAGHIRFVPAGASVMSGAFGSMILSMMAGGRNVPQMIRVRYVAGLSNAATAYPDLISLIKKMTVLSIMSDAFTAQSGSISADGLSQSFSADLDKFKGGIDGELDALRQSIHGIRMAVL